jgi:hypothetical protein
MPTLTRPEFDTIPVLLENPVLGSVTISAIPMGLKQSFKEDLTENGAKIGAANIEISDQLSLVIVNDAKDPNDEELFDFGEKAKTTAADPATMPVIEAPIHFDGTKAYLVLTGISAAGKLTGSATSGSLGVGLDASANLSAAMCVEFDRTVKLCTAIDDVFNHFKTIFSPSELAALRPNETVTLGKKGSLSLKLTITPASFSDAIASGVQGAFKQAFGIQVSASATAKIALCFKVEGGYRIFARRAASPDCVEFSIRKTSAKITTLDGSVGVSVQLENSDVFLKTLSGALSKAVKLPETLVDKALGNIGVDQLNDTEKELISEVVERLHLKDPDFDVWQSFKKTVKTAEETAKRIFEKTAVAAFNYTWSRTTKDSIVARFTLSKEAIQRHHANILRLDIDAILTERDIAGSGVSFDRYLGKKVDTIEIGYGFSLSLAGFTLLKSQDTLSSQYITQVDLEKNALVSFLGKRGYHSNWFGEKLDHVVELNASMPGFSIPPPRPAAFDLGFLVSFTWEDKSFAHIKQEVAEHGLLIEAFDLPVPDVRSAIDKLESEGLPSDTGGNATVSILIPKSVTSLLLEHAADTKTNDLVAMAMARALPCGDIGNSHEIRRNIDIRTKVYAPIWKAFIESENLELTTLGNHASKALQGSDSTLSAYEASSTQYWGWSVQGIVRNAGGVASVQDKVSELRLALLKLLKRGNPGVDYLVFGEALRGLSPFCAEIYGARTFSALLLLSAKLEPGLLKRIVRKVSFSWKSGDEDRKLEFKRGEND